MFKVVYQFADLEDNSHVYDVGDDYPREGYEPSEERIAELSGSKNKIRKPLIEKVKQVKKPVEKKKSTENKDDN